MQRHQEKLETFAVLVTARFDRRTRACIRSANRFSTRHGWRAEAAICRNCQQHKSVLAQHFIASAWNGVGQIGILKRSLSSWRLWYCICGLVLLERHLHQTGV